MTMCLFGRFVLFYVKKLIYIQNLFQKKETEKERERYKHH